MGTASVVRPRKVPVTVALDQDQASQLRTIAESEDTSVSHVVRRMLKGHLTSESISATDQQEVSA